MSTLKAAAERALEALRDAHDRARPDGTRLDYSREIAALRAALAAEQPRPVPAGYLFRVLREGKGRVDEFIAIDCTPDPGTTILSKVPLYATPPAAEPSADERRLRRWLCAARHGHRAYMDDGEASDISAHPWIDYLRDSLDEIDAKWQQRCRAALAAQEGG